MSYTFRVIFEGVAAFVPDEPFFVKNGRNWSEGNPRELTVYVPDLRKSEAVSTAGGLSRLRASHFPLLKFNPRYLSKGTTRNVDLVCRTYIGREERALIFLRREEVRFNVPSQNDKTFEFSSWHPRGRGNEVPNPSKAEQLESLWWLPRLSEISPEWDKLRSDLAPALHPFCMPDSLVARVDIGGGRLRTYDFNRDSQGNPQVWRFADANDDYSDGVWRRAVGNRLALEYFDVVDPVTIELTRNANEVFKETLVLSQPEGSAEPVLEIEIINREPEALFSREEEGALAALPDPDFEEYYFKCCESPRNPGSGRFVPHHRGLVFFGPIKDPCSPVTITAR